jgi:hypothetical protein
MSFHHEPRNTAGAEQTDEPCQNHRRGSLELFRPSLVGWVYVDNAISLKPNGRHASDSVADGNTPRNLELAL